MDVLSPTPDAPAEVPGGRRGRKPGKPLTELELATRRANLAKARAALKRGYPPTEKRLRASLANLAKAQAARRAPQGSASARLNALKHGLFAEQTIEESVDRLGESKEEFEGCLRLFERGFAAADAEELRLVRGLAGTVWRRLRFFHAQARWEKERLQRVFAQEPAQLDVEETVARADRLVLAFMELDPFFRELSKLEARIEFWLRKLIRKRSQGRRRWRGFIRVRDSFTKTLESTEPVDRFVEYWDTLSLDEQAVVWKEFLKVTGQDPAE
jgi:hypothetical protein